MESGDATETDTLGAGWVRLGGGDAEARAEAAEQAREISRALAAQGLVLARDGVLEELEDRLEALEDTVWPSGDPLTGYALHGSLGAFAVAKVAFDLVPAGRVALRREPLSREALLDALVEQGVDPTTAASVLGDWAGVEGDGVRDPDGLPASIVAGLAERSLTRGERAQALAQIAVSPRCLQRLAATLTLVAVVRAVLPLLPPDRLGPDSLVAIVGLALGRPDRVVALLDGGPNTLRRATWRELARAQLSLLDGEPAQLEADPLDGAASAARTAAPRADTEVMEDAFSDDEAADPADAGEGDEDDDVLDVVETRVDPEAAPLAEEPPVEAPPSAPVWLRGDAPAADVEATTEALAAELARGQAPAARHGRLLGLSPSPAPATVRPRPVPFDPRVAAAVLARDRGGAGDEDKTERISIDPLLHGHGLEVDTGPYEAFFVPVRGALRAIAAAAEGEAPDAATVGEAGDLAWAFARARALALIVQGELTGASAAVSFLPDAAAPEGRWAQDRAVRFAGRAAEPVAPDEARPVAAALVADLAQQLARTLAGTVASHG